MFWILNKNYYLCNQTLLFNLLKNQVTMKKYNGFKSEEDYNVVINAVNDATKGIKSINTTAAHLNAAGYVVINLNDVKLTVEPQFELGKKLCEAMSLTLGGWYWKDIFKTRMAEVVAGIAEDEGWK